MARCSHNDCRRWRPDILVRYARLGLRVDGTWFCSPQCVEFTAKRRLLGVRPPSSSVPPIPELRLGVLLLHQGAITSMQLAKALSAQRHRPAARRPVAGHEDGRRRSRAARALGAGGRQLSDGGRSGVCPVGARRGLSADEVRALGVVPIQVDETNRLLVVACQAPLPRAALSALRQLTGWDAGAAARQRRRLAAADPRAWVGRDAPSAARRVRARTRHRRARGADRGGGGQRPHGHDHRGALRTVDVGYAWKGRVRSAPC